jgi:hypothetical protein
MGEYLSDEKEKKSCFPPRFPPILPRNFAGRKGSP